MQRPTCTNTRITTTDDAHRVFHAAGIIGSLPMVYRRLDAEERRFVRPGSVFVWEERSTSSEAAGLGIERWTDGFRWGPSRVRDDVRFANTTLVPFAHRNAQFLFYQEKFTKAEGNDVLTKQTYSAWVDMPSGPKKWHLTAYFTMSTINNMNTVDDLECIRGLTVPEGMYHRSRSGKKKGDSRRLSAGDNYYTLPSPVSDPGPSQHTQASFPLYLPFESRPPSSSPALSPLSMSSSSHLQDGGRQWRPLDERDGYTFLTKRRLETTLAPLSYLQSLQHPRRSPADDMFLRSFASVN